MYPRILFILLFPLIGLAQAPNKINLQSVIRNNLGEVQAIKSVKMRVSILSGSINGSSLYSETHTKTTDANGLISLQIGNGTTLSGVFANIDWGNTSHFIKLEVDFSGGNNFVLLGTQELMSVPYALYATKTDTSSLNLVNRLNAKVNISDTASMLANYRTGLNQKVNIADTASMLNNYLRSGIAANTYQTKLTNPIVAADTASMLSNYRNGLNNKLNILDTTILSNRINTKLNISDFPLGSTPGNMQYWNGTNWVNLTPGLNGQMLQMVNGIPSWSGPAYATLTTNAVASITPTSASVGGNISTDGGASISARGVVYGTSANPTLSNSVLNIGAGTGSFSGSITGLTPNTTYYLKAYATNSAGTNYGNEVSFQTLPVAVPTLITTDASGITQTTVTSGGTISNDGGATVTERGIVYGTSTNPTTSNTKISSGSGTGSFSVNVTSLTPNTTYYIRSYAINSAGTGYGNNITFQTTVPAVPSLTTREILNITNSTATSGGSITNDGGSAISAKGVCWSTSPNPTISDSKTSDGTGTATFSSTLTSLTSGVIYYVRAYATNATGIGYGSQVSFTKSDTIFKGFAGNSDVFVPIDISQWQYIAITKENNIAKIYKNGQLILSGEYINQFYSWTRLDLGAVFYTSYFSWFQGYIDEIRISNNIRSQDEISNNFSRNAPFSLDANTIGLWHFDENSGNTINASAGVNGSTINTNFVEGKFGNCLFYNGINARSEFFQVLPVSIISFEFWIKPELLQPSWPISWYGYNTSGLLLGF